MSSFAHPKACLILGIIFSLAAICFGQDPSGSAVTASGIRIGERLTYNISFQRYENVGYVETFAVSRGKFGDSDAVELRMKIKTTGLLNAAFYPIDETRTTFASPDTGNPLFIRRSDNTGVAVRETISNYLTTPASGFDLLTLIYRVRQSAGSGSFVLVEGEKNFGVVFQTQNGEHLKTDAGEFDTTVSMVQSDYLLENGIQAFKINFSNDDAHIPVLVRFKTAKGEIRIVLSGEQIVGPEVEPTPTPTPVQTPKPVATPRPSATPTPVINQDLSPDLGFSLGEKLDYRVTAGNKTIGEISFLAKERKIVNREDSLLLSATVTSAEQGNGLFAAGDSVTAQVSPETLAPFLVEMKFSGPLAGLNQIAKFDQRAGAVIAGPNRIDSPIGTHCILSLIYAVRSFNLTPSKTVSNPVNDTRVAVYWDGKTYIFTLRPSESETITVNGQKVEAQRIIVNTGVPQFDRLGLKLWLSTDESRVPLRISLGAYQADLIARSKIPLK